MTDLESIKRRDALSTGERKHFGICGIRAEDYAQCEVCAADAAAHDDRTALLAEVARLQAELDTANAACNEVLNSLEWSGDGYEWNPPHGDYRELPMEALRRGQRAHTEQLRLLNIDVASSEAEAAKYLETIDRIDQTLRVDAAEYVPAICDVFTIIDVLKANQQIQSTTVCKSDTLTS